MNYIAALRPGKGTKTGTAGTLAGLSGLVSGRASWSVADLRERTSVADGRKILTMTQTETRMNALLSGGRFIDSDAPDVVAFAQAAAAGAKGDTDRVLRLFGAVRDSIRYDPYVDMGDPANFRASSV